MSLLARLVEIVVGVVVTLVIAEIYHRRIIQTLPGRVIDLLVERGFIPRSRESEARSFVAERFPQWLGALAETLTQQGFKVPPTDVSGKQVLGPADPPKTSAKK